MKNVWLFGDSIRLNYQHVVQRELNGACSVFCPAENGKFAKYTLCMLSQWSADFPKPDVIQWNNGIWDAFRFHPAKGPLTSVEDYCRDTLLITDALAATGAKLIFATTTPTRAPIVSRGKEEVWREDVIGLNEAVVPLLRERGVLINDLYSTVCRDEAKFICEDGIHLTEDGMEVTGRQTAGMIRAALQ